MPSSSTPVLAEQANAVGEWIDATGKRLTHIFATHGHGDHWFTANVLAERFNAKVVRTDELCLVHAQLV